MSRNVDELPLWARRRVTAAAATLGPDATAANVARRAGVSLRLAKLCLSMGTGSADELETISPSRTTECR